MSQQSVTTCKRSGYSLLSPVSRVICQKCFVMAHKSAEWKAKGHRHTVRLGSQCAGLQAQDGVVFPGDLGVIFPHERVILDTQH